MHPERWRGRRDLQTQEGARCWTVNGPQPDSRQGELPGDKKNIPGGREGPGHRRPRLGDPAHPAWPEEASGPCPPRGPSGTVVTPLPLDLAGLGLRWLLLVINRTQTRAGWGPSRVGGALMTSSKVRPSPFRSMF